MIMFCQFGRKVFQLIKNDADDDDDDDDDAGGGDDDDDDDNDVPGSI